MQPPARRPQDGHGRPAADKAPKCKIAEDGEILVRGELVMHGYWRNPEETARVLKDGWLHTGDIGMIDDKGRIKITDRKKDLIINDKGDNVAPQKVEGMLTLQPEIGQAMIAGDRRPYMVAVHRPRSRMDPGMVRHDRRHMRFQDAGAGPRLSRRAAGRGRAGEQGSVGDRARPPLHPRRRAVHDRERAMTPSLKIRRHVLKEVYGARLDALY